MVAPGPGPCPTGRRSCGKPGRGEAVLAMRRAGLFGPTWTERSENSAARGRRRAKATQRTTAQLHPGTTSLDWYANVDLKL